jgi:hypothetical protein
MSLKHTLMLAAVAAVAVGVDGTSPPQTDRSGSKGVQPARRYWAQPSTVQRPMLPFASSPAPVTTAQSAGPGLTTAFGRLGLGEVQGRSPNSPIGGERSGPNINSPIVAGAAIGSMRDAEGRHQP